jgi:hypothetical protein
MLEVLVDKRRREHRQTEEAAHKRKDDKVDTSLTKCVSQIRLPLVKETRTAGLTRRVRAMSIPAASSAKRTGTNQSENVATRSSVSIA